MQEVRMFRQEFLSDAQMVLRMQKNHELRAGESEEIEVNPETSVLITPKLIFDSLLEHNTDYFSALVRKGKSSVSNRPGIYAYGLAGSLTFLPEPSPNSFMKDELEVFAGNTFMQIRKYFPSGIYPGKVSFDYRNKDAFSPNSTLQGSIGNRIAKRVLVDYERSKDRLGRASADINDCNVDEIEAFIMLHFARE